MSDAASEKKSSGRFDLIIKRRTFWLVLALLAAALMGTRFVLRYIYDGRFDAPSRFEQVVWLDSALGCEQDSLRVWLSHLGAPAPNQKKVVTQLAGIAHADRVLSLAELEKKYLRLAPANIPSDNLYVTLSPAKNLTSLAAGFEALAKAGYASIEAGSFWRPTVYSFAIRARLENSRKIFRRTYHFRAWAPGEVALLWFGLFIGIYLVATLSIRGVTILAGHPQRPWDLLRRWFSHLGTTLHIWLLRYIVCRGIARTLKWAAEGLTLLAAIANLGGSQFVPVANVLGFFAALAAVIKLFGGSRSEQLESLRKSIEDKKSAFASRQEIDASELQQVAHLIHELEKLQELCKEIEPAKLKEAGNELRGVNAGLQENIEQLRRDLKGAYQRETQRRAALKVSIAEKIEEARRGVAERVLAYLNSEELRRKLPLFDKMVSEKEFMQVQDPELVFQGERERGQTEYKLISLRPFINSETGEPLLILAVSKEGPNFRIQQFIDEDHPVKAITLPLEQRPSQTVDVRFEVRFGSLTMKSDEALPAAEKIPVSLDHPDPNYAAWYADLPSLREILASHALNKKG